MRSSTTQEGTVTTYGQSCPVSRALELLDERWTTSVVREPMLASGHLLGWPEAPGSGRVEVQGAAGARRAVPRRLGQGSVAAVPRPVATAG
jgi:hypothetical protein